MEVETGSHPELEILLGLQLPAVNGDPSCSHRATLPHLGPSGARSANKFCITIWCDACEQAAITRDAHDHAIVLHERETTEHLDLTGATVS